MKRVFRASCLLAAATAFAFSSAASATPRNLAELVAELEEWIDRNAPWPRRETAPAIRLLSPSLAAGEYGSAGFLGGRLRGFYSAETQTITLVLPWDYRDQADQSVLLHELIHHRQVQDHWYCEAAQELPAYKLQEKWAEERNVPVSINWMAVVLEAGCTPRDIHPE
jgi:hypothetical protein